MHRAPAAAQAASGNTALTCPVPELGNVTTAGRDLLAAIAPQIAERYLALATLVGPEQLETLALAARAVRDRAAAGL